MQGIEILRVLEKINPKKYHSNNQHIPYVEKGSNPMSNYVNQRERIDDAFVSAVFNIDVEEVERLLKTADYDK